MHFAIQTLGYNGTEQLDENYRGHVALPAPAPHNTSEDHRLHETPHNDLLDGAKIVTFCSVLYIAPTDRAGLEFERWSPKHHNPSRSRTACVDH